MPKRVMLTGINRTTKTLVDGRRRIIHYAGRGRGARPFWIRTIPADPDDSPFDEGSPEYLAALAGAPLAKRGKVSTEIDHFIDSPAFQRLAPRTQRDYRKFLEALRVEFGADDLRVFDDSRVRGDVYAWRDRRFGNAREGDYALTVAAIFTRWCKDQGKLQHHQLDRMRKSYRADRAELVFTPTILEAALARAAEEGREDISRALRFGCEYGFRVSDAVRVGWPHVVARDGRRFLAYTTAKRRRVATPEILGDGAAVIDATPRDRLTFLADARGRPWRDGYAMSREVSALLRRAGIARLTFEDTRGTAATRLYLAGMSVEDIGAWMGWSPRHTISVIESYIALVPEVAVERRIRALRNG